MNFIDLKRQYEAYQSEIDAAMGRVLKHGAYIMGPEVRELEEKLATFVGVRHCVAVASGTDSLEIALRALDVGAGDEVITVPFTWISTAEAVQLVGATPVFVDIDPQTYNFDVSLFEAAITERTKAVIPVSLFGQMPDLTTINAIAKERGITVIEDGAQSFGATQNGVRSCGGSDIGSTSFFPAKPFGCYGDGGALFADSDDTAAAMRSIRSHGGEKRHHHTRVGMNGRFDTIQAAVLLAKLPHFEEEVARRSELGERYSRELADVCGVPGIAEGNTHVYGQYTIRVADRDALGGALKERGIPSAVYYPKCLHEQPVYDGLGYRVGDFPVAEKASREVISLPMHPFLSDDEQSEIIAAVRAVVA